MTRQCQPFCAIIADRKRVKHFKWGVCASSPPESVGTLALRRCFVRFGSVFNRSDDTLLGSFGSLRGYLSLIELFARRPLRVHVPRENTATDQIRSRDYFQREENQSTLPDVFRFVFIRSNVYEHERRNEYLHGEKKTKNDFHAFSRHPGERR